MPRKSDNALTTELNAKTKKFRDIQSIMKDPLARAKLQNLVDEAVQAKAAIANQQLIIKALRETALSELELNPKLFNAYTSASFNNDYSVRKEALDEQLTLLEIVMGEVQLIDHDSE